MKTWRRGRKSIGGGVGLVGKLGAIEYIGGKPRVAMACWGACFVSKLRWTDNSTLDAYVRV